MLPRGSFEEAKHPRGWHGRFGFGAGQHGNAHAMRDQKGRPEPHPIKRLHAVTPVKGLSSAVPSPFVISRGFSPTTGD